MAVCKIRLVSHAQLRKDYSPRVVASSIAQSYRLVHVHTSTIFRNNFSSKARAVLNQLMATRICPVFFSPFFFENFSLTLVVHLLITQMHVSDFSRPL